MIRPDTKYARSGEVHIAYQVVGEGPIDMVFVQGFISNLEVQWEDPGLTHLFHRLGSFGRLIIFDKRGSGVSDRVNDMPDLQTRMDDVRAVMDAAGSERAVLIGASEGGPMSILFAATYPQRTRALVLYGAYAHFHSWVLSPEQVQAFIANAEESWGSGNSLKSFAPNLVRDERFRAWWARFERLGTSPAGAIALARMNSLIDVRDLLPAVRVPTLVIHRAQDARVNVEGGRYLARHIAGARYVEVPGVDHPIWVGDTDRVVDEIEEFLTGVRPPAEPDRVLATVVCAEISEQRRGVRVTGNWLERVAQFRQRAASLAARFRGRETGHAPDSAVIIFDGPVRAVRCALAMRDAAHELGMMLRAGIHTGEVEIAGQEIGGAALHIARRITSLPGDDTILVSATVRDLVHGSGLTFAVSPEQLPGGDGIPAVLSLGTAARAAPEGPRGPTNTAAALSPREREILASVAQGRSNAEIAAHFRLSEHTVKRHVANILMKLDLSNRAAAAVFAAQHDLLRE